MAMPHTFFHGFVCPPLRCVLPRVLAPYSQKRQTLCLQTKAISGGPRSASGTRDTTPKSPPRGPGSAVSPPCRRVRAPTPLPLHSSAAVRSSTPRPLPLSCARAHATSPHHSFPRHTSPPPGRRNRGLQRLDP
ncbi:hypothetical protein EMIHUDRAFT_436795 [Emiliania huxleyi CCMP1516]|uniref:Uncharacterized protein n=2 Tax=Emiliania huxleyi TaxID=2903 RepID=A0A0D3IVS0_EMIH1|nr:hypothetical protein EMIHUDRAFT_436795 [Emiliania huxleyi CCMP1516]EOD15355.1 hypothetical protein EMIHUDRAFT_436795 [Emiliania huxleyi CCMP1516]|eukprot:XP_005767784.1 hypothetical protein EMIHUDRAFT_436795 [Emiliania huxleyi CCMP1516]